MLSYLHEFHAGNFADVHKHVALVLTLIMMQRKSSGIACFDTHAGSALYDLTNERARKTGEADQGIQKLWRVRRQLTSGDWPQMLDLLTRLNGQQLRVERYPGSPAWFSHFQRAQDTLTLFERHPAESDRLGAWAGSGSARVQVGDGLAGLLSCLPPPLPRLLVLIDPSYEVKSDYQEVADTLAKAWRRCRHGVFLIWYPVLTSGAQEVLLNRMAAGPVRKVWRSEVCPVDPPARGMIGSGLLVVNPPWGFEERNNRMLEGMGGDQGLALSGTGSWLVPE